MEVNQVHISGVVVAVEPLRVSPGGIAHHRFVLQHRSRQEEVGEPREVFCRIWVEMRGTSAANVDGLEGLEGIGVNDRVKVEGFLDRSGYKDDTGTKLVLHATRLQRFE